MAGGSLPITQVATDNDVFVLNRIDVNAIGRG